MQGRHIDRIVIRIQKQKFNFRQINNDKKIELLKVRHFFSGHIREGLPDLAKVDYLVSYYRHLAENGKVTEDEHQLKALKELDRLRNKLISSAIFKMKETDGSGSKKPTFPLAGIFSVIRSKVEAVVNPPKGVYLHGGVGCGKTFCMNLFYKSIPVLNESKNIVKGVSGKQKVHFHQFMLDVHKQMHEAKMVERVEGDVLPRVIERSIENGLLICFDEFQVTDVADALILRRLFTGLLDAGAVVVTTSNRSPRDLYQNGLQRDLFIPFIELLEGKHNIVSMWDSETDYRLVQGENKARGVYFVGNESKAEFDKAFLTLTKYSETSSTTLSTQARVIKIPQASLKHGVSRFPFDYLCREARGAADYLVIGDHFHTVFVEDVPTLTMNDINVVRRFIVFVDSMYERHVKLIIHAKVKSDQIFVVDLENEFCDEAFAFDRTRSRLEEMGSDEYLKSRWVGSTSQKKEERHY